MTLTSDQSAQKTFLENEITRLLGLSDTRFGNVVRLIQMNQARLDKLNAIQNS